MQNRGERLEQSGHPVAGQRLERRGAVRKAEGRHDIREGRRDIRQGARQKAEGRRDIRRGLH
ncbi:MAG: hypothetical protein LAP13_00260 [Acidobacteriia bacterium]|nr:hypothetical protein [Terriglobia bacterium]